MTDAEAKAQLAQESANMRQYGFGSPEAARPIGEVKTAEGAPAGFGVDSTGRFIKLDTFGRADPYFERQSTTAPENRQYQTATGDLAPPPAAPPAASDSSSPAAPPPATTPTPPAEAPKTPPPEETYQGDKADATKTSSYTVAAGDNLTKIAKKFGTTISAIMAANPSIKNPNLIYAGSSLVIPTGGQAGGGTPFTMPSGYEQINGALYNTAELQRANYTDIQTSPDGTFLYGKKNSVAETINEQAQETFDLTEEAKKAANSTTKYSAQEEAMQKALEEALGIGTGSSSGAPSSVVTSDGETIHLEEGSSAVSLYNQLTKSANIRGLTAAAAAKQEEIDKLNASEVAFAKDILAEVQGEAPQSYIDALVAERSKDLYPKKMALTAELRNIQSQLNAEKENAANILQYTIHDQDNRYNRMFAMLQWYGQRDQQKLSNEIAVMGLLKDLPANRSVTINGKTYKGMAEDAALNVIQFTDGQGNITVVGIDKATGEMKYKKVIGQAKVGGSGTEDSWVKKYTELQAKGDYETLTKINNGTATYVSSSDGKSILVVDVPKYETALKSWGEQSSQGFLGNPFNNTSVDFNGKTYAGDSPSMPSPENYQLVFNK